MYYSQIMERGRVDQHRIDVLVGSSLDTLIKNDESVCQQTHKNSYFCFTAGLAFGLSAKSQTNGITTNVSI